MENLTSKSHKIQPFNDLKQHYDISTTVHATTKSFVPFCSAQDAESVDINCLVFWAHYKNGKILISLERTVDSEWNDVISFVVLYSVAKLFIVEITKKSIFNGLPPQLCFLLFSLLFSFMVVLGSILQVVESLKHIW